MLSKVDDSKKEQLYGLLEDESKRVGLLLNERMMNIPPEVAPGVVKSIVEELEWAIEDDVSFFFLCFLSFFVEKTR